MAFMSIAGTGHALREGARANIENMNSFQFVAMQSYHRILIDRIIDKFLRASASAGWGA
jgi:hypothetical protein